MDTLKAIIIFQLSFASANPLWAQRTPRTLNDGLTRLVDLSPEGRQLEQAMSSHLDEIQSERSDSLPTQNPEGQLFELEAHGVDLDELVSSSEKAVQKVVESSPEEIAKINVSRRSAILAHLIAGGQVGAMQNLISDIMQRLYRPGDSKEFSVKINGSPLPNASIFPGRSEMHINVGLIGWTKNIDELAGVIAHEMTHDNQEHFAAMRDSEDIETVLSKVKGYNDLAPDQREEIRADIGAVDRLIEAGYNPWSYYDFQKRFTKYMHRSIDARIIKTFFRVLNERTFDFWEAHPAGEIRAAAVKSFIIYRSLSKDISDQVQSYENFRPGMRVLQLRARLFSEPMMNIWVQRAVYGYIGYSFTDAVFIALFARSLTDGKMAEQLWRIAESSKLGQAVASIGEIAGIALSSVREVVTMIQAQMSGDLLGTVVSGTLILSALLVITAIYISPVYRSSMAFHSLRDARSTWAQATAVLARAALSGQELTMSEKISALDLQLKTEKSVYMVFAGSRNLVHTYAETNGLALIRFSVRAMIARSLAGLNHDFAKGRMDREWYRTQQSKILAEMSPFAWQSDAIVRELLIAAKHSQLVADGPSDSIGANEAKKAGQSLKLLKLVERSYLLRQEIRKSKDKNKNLGEAISTAKLLADMGLYTHAVSLISVYPRSTMRWALSKSNSDPQIARDLAAVIHTMKSEKELGESSFLFAYLYDLLFAGDRLSRIFNPVHDRLIPTELTRSMRIAGWSPINLKYWLDRSETHRIKRFFQTQFRSVGALASFIDNELISRNFSEQTFNQPLFEALKSRTWITSEADIDVLLRSDYFWPSINSSLGNPGHLEEILIAEVEKNARAFPEVWKYEPASSEHLHRQVYEFVLRTKSPRLATRDAMEKLWYEMTSRGVSSVTDMIFYTLYESSTESQRSQLEHWALNEGRVWEAEIKQRIVIANLQKNADFIALKNDTDSTNSARSLWLEQVLSSISAMYPDRGNGYLEILEFLSTQIESTEAESSRIHQAKRSGAGGKKQEDLGLRVLSDLVNRALKWSRRDQWEFVLFLRGDLPPNQKLKSAFRVTGPARVKRMYDVLPDLVRAQLIDTFIDSPMGLLGSKVPAFNWQKTMISHLLKNSDPQEAQIAMDILDAFMHALKQTGNGPMRSYILSYLYALPKAEIKSAGHTLKQVLEIFGATGIKIGQFIAASEILPEKDTKLLRNLNERANTPDRERIYSDLREGLSSDRVDLKLRHLLGAASMKYAVLATEPSSGRDVVLKVFRTESINHTNMEFKLLESMAGFLTQRNGKKYTVFRSIVKASQAAVEKERSGSAEVVKSEIARQKIYGSQEGKVSIQVPRDVYLSKSVIASDFAEGTSFHEIRAEYQSDFAEAIIKQETSNLFRSSEQIFFDPDRHAGNYRVHVGTAEGGATPLTLSPIDFGQLVEISSQERSEVIELFAVSQILAYSAASEWGTEFLMQHLAGRGLDRSKLKKNLRMLFPARDGKPITSYYLLLASLEGAGMNVKVSYFDFVRAIVQIKQYEKYLPEGRSYQTASELLEAKVQERVNELRNGVRLSPRDKVSFVKAEAQTLTKEGLSWWSTAKVLAEQYILDPLFAGSENDKPREPVGPSTAGPRPGSCRSLFAPTR